MHSCGKKPKNQRNHKLSIAHAFLHLYISLHLWSSSEHIDTTTIDHGLQFYYSRCFSNHYRKEKLSINVQKQMYRMYKCINVQKQSPLLQSFVPSSAKQISFPVPQEYSPLPRWHLLEGIGLNKDFAVWVWRLLTSAGLVYFHSLRTITVLKCVKSNMTALVF